MVRSPLHFMVSKNTMLMTYTGRKSGKSYTTPVNYLEMNGALYTTSSRDRVWWRNLRDGADVSLHLRGQQVPARSETIEDQSNVAISMRKYLESAPHMARYMDVQVDEDGNPDEADINRLAKEKIMVRTELN